MSVSWSVVDAATGFVTVIAVIMVVTSERGTGWIAVGVVFGSSAAFALGRVYVAFVQAI